MAVHFKKLGLKRKEYQKNKRLAMYEKEISRCHNIQWAKKYH